MKYEALNDTVVLKQIGKEGELIVCRVVDCGPGLLTMAGRVPLTVRPSDIILINPYKPSRWIQEDGNVLLLAKQHQLQLRINSYGKS